MTLWMDYPTKKMTKFDKNPFITTLTNQNTKKGIFSNILYF